MPPRATLVCIPTYDEAATLRTVVDGVLDIPEAHVLIVDDASPDGTGALADGLALADDRVTVLHRPRKAGLGSAYRAAFAEGLRRDVGVFVEIDADLSHDPADVPRLLQALDGVDVAVGSRYVPGGGVRDWPYGRRLLSRAGNRYVRGVTGIPVRDATSGLRAYRREVIEELDVASVSSDGYSFQVELVLRAWRLGFRIVEVPITFTERRLGASKISRPIVFEALWRVGVWGLRGPRGAAAVHGRSVANAVPR